MRYSLTSFTVNLLVSFWLISTANLYASPQKTEILVIMDASASMEESFENSNKLQKAKESISEVFTGLPSDFFIQNNVGLRVYGHRYSWKEEEKSCKDTELVFPIGKIDPKSLIKAVNALQALGSTPIAYSLMKGAEDFSKEKEVRRYILLVSDGAETCGGDPVAVIKELQAKGINVIVNAIGFAVKEDARRQLEAIAAASGGRYYSAKASLELKTEMEKLLTKPEPEIVKPAPPKEVNILAASQGGQLIASANNELFNQLIDGQDAEVRTFWPGQEAIFAFKGKKIVTLEKLAVPIFESYMRNIKEILVWVSTSENPLTKEYEAVGRFEAANIGFADNPYQELVFDKPIPTRFLKIRLESAQKQGEYIVMYELRAYGKFEEPGPEVVAKAPPKLEAEPAPPKEVNILAASQGGQLIASANNELFKQLIDEKDAEVRTFWPGQEAIFAFKDKKIVVLEKIAVPVFGTYIRNVKEILVWVSTSENPLKGFEAVGRFEVANIAFADKPYQEFIFDKPMPARFIKIRLESAQKQGEYIVMFELRAYGKFE